MSDDPLQAMGAPTRSRLPRAVAFVVPAFVILAGAATIAGGYGHRALAWLSVTSLSSDVSGETLRQQRAQDVRLAQEEHDRMVAARDAQRREGGHVMVGGAVLLGVGLLLGVGGVARRRGSRKPWALSSSSRAS